MAASLAWSQVATGSLSGIVTDPNGAAVPDVKVEALREETGQKFETNSNEAGLYVFPTLSVGRYTVSVEKAGFKRLSRANIEVRVAQRLALDLRLEIGDVQQSVEVTAEAPLLEAATAERGQNFSPKFMQTLPLFTGGIRNPEAFITYMPGVNAGAEVSISGSGGRGKEVLLDGASATIPESGGVVFNFQSNEQFGEFKLLTANYSAEFGRFGGGVEIFVTRSGTNDLHGGAFWNLRRDIWNANSWANNRLNRRRAKERFNEVGGVIGGPVWVPKLYDGRNKTFWFFTTARDLRPAVPLPATSTVPTQAMKEGNFSTSPQPIYDPLTTAGNVRQLFPGGIIPRSRFSRVSSNILPLIPDPTRSGTTTNFDYVGAQVIEDVHWSLKFDHSFTPNNRVAYYMSRQNQNIQNNQVFPGPLGQGLGANTQRPQSYRLNHDLVIKPTVLLHSTFGFTRQQQGWDNPAQKGYGSKIGLPLTGLADAFPRVQWLNSRDGLTPWGVQDGKVSNGTQFNWTYHFNQILTYLRGKHEFRLGWDFRRLRTFSDPVDLAGTNGLYRFNTFQTGLPGNTNTGHPFASFLLGNADYAATTSLPVLAGNIRYGYHAAFFQDNWKVTPRLTLNLGFRYDVPIGWHDRDGEFSFVDLSVTNPATGTRGALMFGGTGPGRIGKKRPYPTDWSNVGPRFGFAYRLMEKTVIRGGWGIYYQTLGNGGCGCRTGYAGPPIERVSDQINPALQWDGGIPIPPGIAAPPFIDPTFANGLSVDVMTPTFGLAPRIHEWSFNVQQEYKNFLFDVAYVGNRAYRLASTVNLNALPVSRLALGSLLTQRIDSPAVQAQGFREPFAGFTRMWGGGATLAQALRPYPQYATVSGRNAGVGRIWYDSLQIKVERRFGSLQMMTSYTWSKTLSLAHYRQIFTQTQVAAQDWYNYRDMKSFLPFHQPHVLNVLLSYDLPVGRGKKFANVSRRWIDTIIGGWNVAMAARYYTPTLLQVTAPVNDLANTTFGGIKKANRNNAAIRTSASRGDMDRLLNAFLAGGTAAAQSDRYFNPGAFSAPTPLTLGNAALFYNDFRNPNIYTENFAMTKRFKIPVYGDRTVDLLYRADAFNLFNRTNFGSVVSAVGNPNFGLPTGPMTGARIITMGLRLDF